MNLNIFFQAIAGAFVTENGKPTTKSSPEKIMRAERLWHGNIALSDSALLLKQLTGSFSTFILSLVAIGMLLFSQLTNGNVITWGTALAYIFLMGFVIAALGTRFTQSLTNYRHAQDLGRFGLMTKGMILDKWVSEMNGKLVYQVSYQYLMRLTAVQLVDQDTFTQLRHNANVFVLYLENLPHISRLDLD